MPAPLDPIRKKLGDLMDETVAAHANWTYREVRPLPILKFKGTWAALLAWVKKQKVEADCSWGVKDLCSLAGAPDPMNSGYGPYGNSATLCAHLPHLPSPSALKVGDIVTRGKNGDDHASMVRTPGQNPVLWGFGHQGAPNFSRLFDDKREFQCLRLILPDWKPTRKEILQAKTGYWAWVQWQLGEGDWRGLKPRDKSVRPDVQGRIVLSWRIRFVRFKLRRKKPNKATAPVPSSV